MESRICPQCTEERASSDFSKNNRICKACKADNRRQKYRNDSSHREENLLNNLNWKKQNPDVCTAYKQTWRTNKAGTGGVLTAEVWRRIKEYFNYTCLCCNKKEPLITLTPDHVVPIALGGSSDPCNIQPLCLKCNISKSDTHKEYRKYTLGEQHYLDFVYAGYAQDGEVVII